MFLLLIFGNCYCQNGNADSLLLEFKMSKSPIEKAKLSKKIIISSFVSKYEIAVKFIDSLNSYAKISNDKEYLAQGARYLGIKFQRESNFKKAIECYKRANVLFYKINDTISPIKNYNNIAVCYFSLNQIEPARFYYQKVILKTENFNEHTIIGSKFIARLNYGTFLKDNGYTDESIKMFKKAIDVAEKMDNKTNIADVLIQLSEIHRNKGNLILAEKEARHSIELLKNGNNFISISNAYQSLGLVSERKKERNFNYTLKCFLLSLEYAKKNQNEATYSIIYSNIANTYSKLKDNTNTVKYIDSAYIYADKNNNELGYASILITKANISEKQKLYDKVISNLLEAAEIYESRNKPNNLGEIYKRRKEYKKSAEYYKKSADLFEDLSMSGSYDTLTKTEENIKNKVASFLNKKQTNKDDKQDINALMEEKQKNNKGYSKWIFTIVILVMFPFLRKGYIKRKEQKRNLINNSEFSKINTDDQNEETTITCLLDYKEVIRNSGQKDMKTIDIKIKKILFVTRDDFDIINKKRKNIFGKLKSNYISIITEDNCKYYLNESLKTFIDKYPHYFKKISGSIVVNRSRINKGILNQNRICMEGYTLVVGRTFRQN